MNIDQLIAKAEQLAIAGDDAAALSMADHIVADFSRDMRSWSLRAYLHARRHEYGAAIDDLNCAIEINDREPSLFFDRGRYHLIRGTYDDAVDDFSAGLRLCDYYKNDYYREALSFMRAEAFLRLGNKSAARSELMAVRDNFTLWTDRLRTKSEMLRECDRP
jgi:tetratricopeptide (TPR) repeat protein